MKDCAYADENVPKNKAGWIVDKDFTPASFVLVKLWLDDDKTIMGWWTGSEWYSRKLGDRKIQGWKRAGEYKERCGYE